MKPWASVIGGENEKEKTKRIVIIKEIMMLIMVMMMMTMMTMINIMDGNEYSSIRVLVLWPSTRLVNLQQDARIHSNSEIIGYFRPPAVKSSWFPDVRSVKICPH